MIKRMCVLMMCAVLLASFPAIAAENGKNLIINGSFEKHATHSVEDWILTRGKIGSGFSLSSEAHGGATALKIDGNGLSYSASQQIAGIRGGGEYELSVWVKTKAAAGFGARAQFYKKADTLSKDDVAGEEQKMEFSPAGGEWQQITQVITAPRGTAAIVLYLYNNVSDSVLFDDVRLVSTGTAVASSAGLNAAVNHSFEKYTTTGIDKWYIVNGKMGDGFEIAMDPHEGSAALNIVGDKRILSINHPIAKVYGGMDYEFSVWVKSEVPESFGLNLKFYNKPNSYDEADATGPEHRFWLKSTNGEWQQITNTIAVPEGTTSAVIYLFNYNTGEVLFDDVQFCPLGEIPDDDSGDVRELQSDEKKEPVPGAENMIVNGDMEIGSGPLTTTAEWRDYGRGNSTREFSEEEARSGKQSIKITTTDPSLATNGASAFQNIIGLAGGAEYQFSAFVKTSEAGAYFKLEFYGTETPSSEGYFETRSPDFSLARGEWTEVLYRFVIPEGKKSMAVILRQNTAGTTYWDDASCYMTELPPTLSFETDQYFYYSDGDYGRATIGLNPYQTTYEGNPASFKVSDGDTLLHEERFDISVGKTEILFDLALLTEKKKEYTLSITLMDPAGGEIDAISKPAYKYDRPTTVSKDGYMLSDGKPFFPVMFNTSQDKEFYPVIKSMGGNTATALYTQLDEYTKIAKELGMKMVVPLYLNMKPAGHPDNVRNTTDVVTKWKDEPTILAWAIMDEPFTNHVEEEHMLESYRIIRDIDDMHPVYSVEAITVHYEWAAKFVDVLVTDAYTTESQSWATNVATANHTAYKAVEYKKPVFSISAVYEEPGHKFPTTDELRSTIYQAMFEDAAELGFWTWKNPRNDGRNLNELEIADDIAQMLTDEIDDASRAFVLKEYPVFNDNRKNDIWYRTYIKNDQLYCIVLNRDQSSAVTGTIDMTSFDGKHKIDGYKVESLYGTSRYVAESTGATAQITLQPCGAAVYRITPNVPQNLSSITRESFEKGGFADLYQHDWVREQVSSLAQKGIISSEEKYLYKPGDNITRGDFAMFLVRALGLTAHGAEGFDDVSPFARYAKEVAIGKAHGILDGVGDNRFEPEATISRQDLMTIVSRTLELTEQADISVFSDADLVADYARAHTQAMVQSGLVQGNSDGTLNPLGSSTRAEAAVIMDRIIQRGR